MAKSPRKSIAFSFVTAGNFGYIFCKSILKGFVDMSSPVMFEYAAQTDNFAKCTREAPGHCFKQ